MLNLVEIHLIRELGDIAKLVVLAALQSGVYGERRLPMPLQLVSARLKDAVVEVAHQRQRVLKEPDESPHVKPESDVGLVSSVFLPYIET